MNRQLPGTFRTSGQAANQFANVNDVVNWRAVAYDALRSKGSALIDTLPLVPLQADHWSIIGVSITAYLARQFGSGAGTGGHYGQLGKIIAGLVPFGAQSPVALWAQSSPQPRPPDTTLTAVLWDPAVDQLPPNVPIVTGPAPDPTTMLPISCLISPSIPRDLQAGDSMGIGIWMDPMLLGSVPSRIGSSAMAIFYAGYVVTYDDHL